jgi:Uma2 family endonuclease
MDWPGMAFKKVRLVDLRRWRIEVHRKPGKSGYSDVQVATRSLVLAPTILNGIEIAVGDILPPLREKGA